MDARDKRMFWINWFVGGAGVVLGAFGIGLLSGAAWMRFWPISIATVSTTAGALVAIGCALMAKSGTHMNGLIRRREEQPTDSPADDSE
jgi:hypothetical protein